MRNELEEIYSHVPRCQYGCLPKIHMGAHEVHMDQLWREANLKLLATGGVYRERAYAQEEYARLAHKAWLLRRARLTAPPTVETLALEWGAALRRLERDNLTTWRDSLEREAQAAWNRFSQAAREEDQRERRERL